MNLSSARQYLELRDCGLLYYQLGHYPQAADDLQTYLAKFPDAEDAAVIWRLLVELGIRRE
jgi:regulator of sirC expression with transglutaminase-like and TPR domain